MHKFKLDVQLDESTYKFLYDHYIQTGHKLRANYPFSIAIKMHIESLADHLLKEYSELSGDVLSE